MALGTFLLCNNGAEVFLLTFIRVSGGVCDECCFHCALLALLDFVFIILIFLFNKELEVINQMKQRMRRISALLLVALMCVSCVVPAFAAESERCPVVHTKSNCEYTQIGEPHEAACGVQGYTTYQCNACKAYFADDFVNAAGDHAWQTVVQAPTCTEDGFEKSVCLNCGEEKLHDTYEATKHKWDFKNGEDCAEGLICEVCGEETDEVGDKGHKWGKAELTVKPTHTTSKVKEGTAKFTCEICGETKTVSVFHDGDCWWKVDITKYPSCEEAGYYGGATCVICGKKVHLVKAENCTATCTVEGCDHTVDEKNCGYKRCTIEGCKHYVEGFAHCDPATCEDTNCADTICHKEADCTATNKDECVHSYAPYQEMAIINCKPSVEWVVELPTCTKAGSAYKACTMCKNAVGTPVVLDPLGHNYQTKIYEVVEVGGLTAEQIALFDALAEGVEYVQGGTHTYKFYVEGENGELTLVSGTATLEDYVLADAEDLGLTVAPTVEDEEEDEEEVTYYAWTGEYKYDDPLSMDAGNNTYIHWGENCSTSSTFWSYVCIDCEYRDEAASSSFVGHYWVKTGYQAPVCGTMANGWTEYTCANPNCDGILVERDKDVKDVVDYDVTTVEGTYTDANSGVEVDLKDGAATKKEFVAAGHVFTTVTVPVTCVSVGYKYDVCSCGAIDYSKAAEGYGEEDTPANAIKGAYDIVEDANAHAKKDHWVIKVTCEEDGKKHVGCSNVGCEYYYNLETETFPNEWLEQNVKVDALGHKKSEAPHTTGPAADCTNAQYAYYECENGCGEDIAEEIAPKLGHNYQTNKEEPDCTKKKVYITVSCSRCGDTKTETAPSTAFDKTNPAHHSGENIIDVVTGNCTKLDTVTYKCEACGEVWDVEEDVVGAKEVQGIIRNFTAGQGSGHDYKEVKAKKPTCTTDGWKAHYECSVCGALAEDEEGATPLTADDVKIPKLSETGDHPKNADGSWDETKLYWTEAVAPTCTDDGHDEGLFCTVCDSWVDEEKTIPAYEHYLDKDNEDSAWVPVTDAYASDVASCTTWGYQLYECSLCKAQKIDNYDPMKTEDGQHKLIENDDAEIPTCCTPGYTASQTCTVCEQQIVDRVEIDKVAHVNKDGEKFFGICTETVEDRVCVYCAEGKFPYTNEDGEEAFLDANSDQKFACVHTGDNKGNHDYKATINYAKDPETNEDTDEVLSAWNDNDVIVAGNENTTLPSRVEYPVADAEKLAVGAHKWVVTYVAPTCMSYSYTLIVCEHCGYDFITDEGATYSDEHAWGEWEITKATYTADGKKVRECELCDATEEVVIPKLVGITADVELGNAVNPDAPLPDNGVVSLTVTTNASDLNVWGIRIELTYVGKIAQDENDKDIISIVSVSDKFGAEGLQVYHDAANKKITIVGTAPNGADGKIGEVNFNGEEELVKIELALRENTVGDGISVSTEKFEVNDKAQNNINAEINGFDTIWVEVESGDVDGDYDVDIDDAKALKMIITGESEEEYNAAADMNQDGEVTATDFAAITNKLLGKKA